MSSRISTLVAGVMLTATMALVTPAVAMGAVPTIGGSWAHLPPLPDGVSIFSATGAEDGRLYVFGFCEVGPCPQTGGNVGVHSPVTYRFRNGDWQPRRPAPAICGDAQASALGEDNTIFLAGCWQNQVTDPGFRTAAYDPEDNTWTLLPGHGPYVNPIVGMGTEDGRIFWYSETLRKDGGTVFVSGHRVLVDRFGDYNLRAKEPNRGPSDGAGLGSDGHVYAAGGDRNCQPSVGACHVPPVMEWNPRTNNWSKPTVMRVARIRVAVTDDEKGRIWTIGGIRADGSDVFDKVEVFRPHSGTWAQAADLPDKRWDAVAGATLDGRVWVVQGFDQFGNPLSDGYVFTPS